MTEEQREILASIIYYLTMAVGFLGYAFSLMGGYLLVLQVNVFMQINFWAALPLKYLFIKPENIWISGLTSEQLSWALSHDSTPALIMQHSIFKWYEFFPSFSQWLSSPHGLFGLHSLVLGVLDFIPTAFFLIVGGLIITYISSTFEDIMHDMMYK